MKELKNYIRLNTLAEKYLYKLQWSALSLAEKQLERFTEGTIEKDDILLDENFYRRIVKEMRSYIDGIATGVKFSTFIPAGFIGFKLGAGFPDTDIKLLGIGKHRYFIFHSGISVFIFKKMYEAYLKKTGNFDKAETLVDKILGVTVSLGAFGTGVHLLSDAIHPKSVVFPFFGSLVDGTMVDDNIWLIGNALWCFKIGKDVLVTAIGDDLEKVKRFVAREFAEPLLEAIKEKKNAYSTGN